MQCYIGLSRCELGRLADMEVEHRYTLPHLTTNQATLLQYAEVDNGAAALFD
jgi:hypothetical protein